MKKKETSSVRTILPSRRRKSSNRAFGVYPFQGEVLLSTTYGDSPDERHPPPISGDQICHKRVMSYRVELINTKESKFLNFRRNEVNTLSRVLKAPFEVT
ncbi:LOW QUALITY PROTEIN: hypothetical protein V1478_008764 [Vespula squamosa]|uniref:Uncharacterized protein n=1 Tax=Vespula squamosa TaxID=30214 RepID=A0ABD2AV42_VESSQ